MDPSHVITLDSSFQTIDPERLRQMQSKTSYEGDNDYTQYQLPPFTQTERMFRSGEEKNTPQRERAFTIANKATTAMETNHFDDATKMTLHALELDPLCIDGWRNLCRVLNQICDGDTIVCATREVINFARQFYKEQFDENNGMFYTMPITRPYIRTLQDIAHTSLQSEQLDVSVYTYEEILRLNHNDNNSVRDNLLSCYIKLIGRIQRFPDTKPVRTIEQAEQLINAQFGPDPLFEEDNLTVRWAKICFAYLRNKNWQQMAKKEYEKNDLVIKILLNEIEPSQIPPSNPMYPLGCSPGNKSDEARLKTPKIKEALNDWPDFVIALHKLIKGKISSKTEEEIRSVAPDPVNDVSKNYKEQMLIIGNQFLDQGRKFLSDRNFLEAEKNFTLAKRGFYEASLPSRRCYEGIPFAVFSNRATTSFYLHIWNLLRIDTRYTLMIKPDHPRTYLRLVKLAEAFKSKQLIDDFQQIEDKVKNQQVNSMDEWKALAKTVIGLTSITAIAFAAEGILTQEKKDELIEIGIEDFYTTVNVGSEYNTLPWLGPNDFEPKIQ